MSALLLVGLLGIAQAHDAHGTGRAWEACAQNALGDRCAWRDATEDLYQGTCRSMGGALVCVRDRPIVRAEVRRAPVWLGALAIGAVLLVSRTAAPLSLSTKKWIHALTPRCRQRTLSPEAQRD